MDVDQDELIYKMAHNHELSEEEKKAWDELIQDEDFSFRYRKRLKYNQITSGTYKIEVTEADFLFSDEDLDKEIYIQRLQEERIASQEPHIAAKRAESIPLPMLAKNLPLEVSETKEDEEKPALKRAICPPKEKKKRFSFFPRTITIYEVLIVLIIFGFLFILLRKPSGVVKDKAIHEKTIKKTIKSNGFTFHLLDCEKLENTIIISFFIESDKDGPFFLLLGNEDRYCYITDSLGKKYNISKIVLGEEAATFNYVHKKMIANVRVPAIFYIKNVKNHSSVSLLSLSCKNTKNHFEVLVRGIRFTK